MNAFPVIFNQRSRRSNREKTRRWFNEREKIINAYNDGTSYNAPETVAEMNKVVAYDLGVLKREFDEGLDPSTVENFDETHM